MSYSGHPVGISAPTAANAEVLFDDHNPNDVPNLGQIRKFTSSLR